MIIDSLSAGNDGSLFTRTAPRIVFKTYMKALGEQTISNTNYVNHINISLVKNCPTTNVLNVANTYDLTYGKLSTALSGNLVNTNMFIDGPGISDRNSETSMQADVSYQCMFNQPCSAILKDPNTYGHNIQNSLITNDSEYQIWCSSAADEYSDKHMELNYNFETKYNETEYEAFGVSEDYVTESCLAISANTFEIDRKTDLKNAFVNGCAGIVLSYTDSNHKSDNMIPMMYYEFEKPVYSNNNQLTIEWNTNGILTLE